ncbi:AP2/ERF family transcription factor [Inquilinus sp. Marseille-Q2685]|uniref:AP2/ERF family transcription factor n=1 Tax=Inquilinus sp. Marseille-Q2685 TaxID=2866581 RepID=UPI001CE432DC|nr:AP2/ERF family transcription factor [Inquilinus sp. Marseille-Q2685]
MRVSRIDNPEKRMLGWLVRYSVAGRHTRKFFSDLAHGSSAKAKAAAEAFALEHLDEHHEIRSLRTRLLPRKNTPHGVPGVARYVRPGGTSAFWTAYWTQDGVRRQKKFSIALLGEREARELAFATRAEMTADNQERLTELLDIHAPDRRAAAQQRRPAPEASGVRSLKVPARHSPRPATVVAGPEERRKRA